jgi:peptide/nickel transport system substrate-binding protein
MVDVNVPRRVLGATGLLTALRPGRGMAQAAPLRIGALTDPSMDPHFLYLTTNMAYSQHLFDALSVKDENSHALPGLAESWRPLDERRWEFVLRRGVKFHDGSDLTAADVKFSIERVTSLPANPAPYTPNLRGITEVEILDDHRLRFTTSGPVPVLYATLGAIYIVSHRAAAGTTPADFRSGRAAIGTGPYRFGEYLPAQLLELTRWDGYWGPKAAFERVQFRFIPNSGARLAALLSNEVDVADFLPPEQLNSLRGNPQVQVLSRPSDRVIYLVPDVARDVSPFIRGRDGQPLTRNPLKDVRVRRALSLAINREGMARQTMDGLADPVGQIVPRAYGGYNAELLPDPFDPDRARRLLAEAGYPNGFQLTLHGPNDRYVNDARVLQAVGAMLNRIGLETRVEAMPRATYFGRAQPPRMEFSLSLVGWGSAGEGESGYGLSALLHSRQPERGLGGINIGGYANPVFDAAVQDALSRFEAPERHAALQRAMRIAMEDAAVIPLFVQHSAIAVRRGITYVVRDDEKTIAMQASPAR